jgi:hypothetical protein
MIQKYVKGKTPIGIARYPFLTEPVSVAIPTADPKQFKVQLVLQDAKEIKALTEELTKINDAHFEAISGANKQKFTKRKLPIQKLTLEADSIEGTGFLFTTSRGQPAIFAADGTPWDMATMGRIGGGTTLMVSFTGGESKHNIHGAGSKFYLNQVMVDELVEYTGGTAGGCDFTPLREKAEDSYEDFAGTEEEVSDSPSKQFI